ncbi:MAG TPA: class II aldolase/adducin family protein [Anaerolineae bacterium]|nr:class II aldolase/adducin family protein [Anaerolineae bacterium]
MPVSTEQHLRREIIRIGKLLYDKGLIVATDGNVSARLDANRILATPSGLCKGFMEPEQLIVVDLDGNRVGSSNPANRHLKPTSEMRMHLEAYRRRPDVGAVVHAHPSTTVALSIAGVDLAQCLIPEVIVTLGIVPTTQYATPSSEENARAIRDLIAGHDAIVVQRHGTLTVGRDPLDAFLKTESIEQMSRIAFMARLLGASPVLPPEEVVKLIAQREALGLSRLADAEDFCAHCGVCHAPGQHVAPAERNPDEAAFVREVTERVLKRMTNAE